MIDLRDVARAGRTLGDGRVGPEQNHQNGAQDADGDHHLEQREPRGVLREA